LLTPTEGPPTRPCRDRLPEQHPIIVASPITVFNGGERGGKVTLLIHTFITVPAPAARKGAGLHSVAKVPVIAGGSGSVLDFKFKLGRNYTYKGRRVGFLEAVPRRRFQSDVAEDRLQERSSRPRRAGDHDPPGKPRHPCTPKG
jgi:hypothetical protein